MMKKSRASKPSRNVLTAAELEMMNVIWRIGPCSVAQVQEELLPQRELAYTSVSTIVRILEQKEYVTSQKEGRGHLYEVEKAIRETGSRDVWEIIGKGYETDPDYLPRVMAAILIVKNPTVLD